MVANPVAIRFVLAEHIHHNAELLAARFKGKNIVARILMAPVEVNPISEMGPHAFHPPGCSGHQRRTGCCGHKPPWLDAPPGGGSTASSAGRARNRGQRAEPPPGACVRYTGPGCHGQCHGGRLCRPGVDGGARSCRRPGGTLYASRWHG